jgi:hypothetical protein
MTLVENLDIYDRIENPATKEKYFIKNIYPYYLYMIYKYNLKLFHTSKVDEDMIGFIMIKLISFQNKRMVYDVKQVPGYIKKIMVNAINDYMNIKTKYQKNIFLFSDLDN